MKTVKFSFVFLTLFLFIAPASLFAADFGSFLDIFKPGSGSSDSSQVSGSAGTRGIGEDEGYTSNAPPDFQSVSWLEKFTVNEAVIKSFLKNGGLRTNIVIPKRVDASKEEVKKGEN